MNEKPNTDQLADELAALFWEQTDLSANADRHGTETIAEKGG